MRRTLRAVNSGTLFVVSVYAGLNLFKNLLYCLFPALSPVYKKRLAVAVLQAYILFIKRLKAEKRFYLFERSEL